MATGSPSACSTFSASWVSWQTFVGDGGRGGEGGGGDSSRESTLQTILRGKGSVLSQASGDDDALSSSVAARLHTASRRAPRREVSPPPPAPGHRFKRLRFAPCLGIGQLLPAKLGAAAARPRSWPRRKNVCAPSVLCTAPSVCTPLERDVTPWAWIATRPAARACIYQQTRAQLFQVAMATSHRPISGSRMESEASRT